MNVLVVLLMLGLGALAMPQQPEARVADSCDSRICVAPNCRCSGTNIPGNIPRDQTPQFVLLTFDDDINILNMENYKQALYNRINPNGCPIAATYFVSHEYTDYNLVHELHARGHEISLHSISHQSLTTYWKEASVATLTKEFADERTLISHFANIPAEDLKGIRMPFLQMAGNNQFSMLKQSGFLYDLSWTTQDFIEPGLWPYTTEYRSTQECMIPPCPTESFPGVWVIPMVNWKDESGNLCSMVDACVGIPTDVDGIVKWMIREFEKQYNGNRAPFGFYVHSGWFQFSENHFTAYIKFLDYLQKLPDVFLSSGSQVIDWVKKPVPVSEMRPGGSTVCQKTYTPTCNAKECQLVNNGSERWMKICTSKCPASYPWLGNPLGL